jgi:hypothetical protein
VRERYIRTLTRSTQIDRRKKKRRAQRERERDGERERESDGEREREREREESGVCAVTTNSCALVVRFFWATAVTTFLSL